MSKATKTDPILWAKVVKRLKNSDKGGSAGTWNARKAQIAVAEYKKQGGTYKGKKSAKNSLAVWTDESWDYIDGKHGNRYLPKNVRNGLTAAEAKEENLRKRSATRRRQSRAKYSKSVAAKVAKSKKSIIAKRKSRKSRN